MELHGVQWSDVIPLWSGSEWMRSKTLNACLTRAFQASDLMVTGQWSLLKILKSSGLSPQFLVFLPRAFLKPIGGLFIESMSTGYFQQPGWGQGPVNILLGYL